MFLFIFVATFPIVPQGIPQYRTSQRLDVGVEMHRTNSISACRTYCTLIDKELDFLDFSSLCGQHASHVCIVYLALIYLPWHALLGMPPPPLSSAHRVSSGRHSALLGGDVRGGLRRAQAAFGEVLRDCV